jgi:hypothetical protein
MREVLRYIASDLGIVIIATLILFAVYAIDTITPLGEPVWLLYFIPLIVSYWSTRYYAIPTVCIVTVLFLIIGFLVSPRGVPLIQAILYRYVFFLVFLSVSIILWVIRRQQIIEDHLA